jgi:head-tail adaptor
MIDADLLPHTITVLTPTVTTDSYGNTVQDWAAPVERQVAAYVRPGSGSSRSAAASEDTADRDAVTTVWQVHTNDQAITALDRVRHNGVVYDIDGRPLSWDKAPDGETGHTKLLLRRVDG